MLQDAINHYDYSPEHWKQITDHRRRNHWETPKSILYDYIKGIGYTDSLREYTKNYPDSPIKLEDNSIIRKGFLEKYGKILKNFIDVTTRSKYTENVFEPSNDDIVTCWAGTRIDYVWLSKEFKGEIVDYKVIRSNASDHYPVIVTIKLS